MALETAEVVGEVEIVAIETNEESANCLPATAGIIGAHVCSTPCLKPADGGLPRTVEEGWNAAMECPPAPAVASALARKKSMGPVTAATVSEAAEFLFVLDPRVLPPSTGGKAGAGLGGHVLA